MQTLLSIHVENGYDAHLFFNRRRVAHSLSCMGISEFFPRPSRKLPRSFDTLLVNFYLYFPLVAQTASTVEMRRVSEQGFRRTAENTAKFSVELRMGVALRSTMGIPA